MRAGSPRVIVSLWKVDDAATRALMKSFYEHWREGGLSTAEALRAAQDEIRKDPQWRDPRYWAAWVLWGPAD
jgi:CHAT domain-containing protein